MAQLYTIGYATKSTEVFINQLKTHHINVVADIRSVPYSKVFYDYHKEKLAKLLLSNDIHYVYLGKELGPRSNDPEHYDENGQVQFSQLMQSTLFLEGIKRLQAGLQKNFHIALLCAEKDPAICHRSLLVSYYIARHFPASANTVLHIHHDGNTETQQALEERLIALHNIEMDLFMSKQERGDYAYKMQIKKFSYCKPK